MTTFDALTKLAGKQTVEEHPACVLFHPEAGEVCDGMPQALSKVCLECLRHDSTSDGQRPRSVCYHQD
eukprot:1536976-Amphidinium_carterae.1